MLKCVRCEAKKGENTAVDNENIVSFSASDQCAIKND